jgi:hypothetical protein
MAIVDWWHSRRSERTRRQREYRRMRSAHQIGRAFARRWACQLPSVVRPIESAVDDACVAIAFRHGLVEGRNMRDAVHLAQCVLSGMSRGAQRPTRRLRRFKAYAHVDRAGSHEAAFRGIRWMAQQALSDPAGVDPLHPDTLAKIQSWFDPRATPRVPLHVVGS